MSPKTRCTVETLAAGQPRPHADSRYHYRITVEWQGLAGYKDANAPFVPRPELSEEIVRPILRALVGGWSDLAGLGCRSLVSCIMVAPGVWDVRLTQPYCD